MSNTVMLLYCQLTMRREVSQGLQSWQRGPQETVVQSCKNVNVNATA